MMKKKLFALLLVAALLLSVFPASVFAAEIVDSGTCGENLTWTLDSAGVLTISGTGEMSSSGIFEGREDITTVVIQPGMTSIKNDTFSCCPGLTSIIIPDSVTYIGGYAFLYCDRLKSVTIPNSVITIGDMAFAFCERLTSVTIPSSVIHFGEGPFAGCVNLAEILVDGNNPNYRNDSKGALFTKDSTELVQVPGSINGAYAIPEGITKIGNYAFYDCAGLTGITIPDGVASIGEFAFYRCTNLGSVVIPGSVTSIGEFALSECTNLATTAIPRSVTSIGQNAFFRCAGLKTVYYAGSKEDRNEVRIEKGNDPLLDAKWLYNIEVSESNPFYDVPKDKFYYDAVQWAVDNDITSGKTDTTFAPDEACTRGQVVTFLWRANGSPKPTGTDNPFADVKPGQFYTDAVLWAVENGITAGVDATHFKPDAKVSRAQFVTFLYRAKGKPAATGTNPFKDVQAGQFYTDAVTWAVENDITAGLNKTTFGVDSRCTRGQVVTFLYRAYQ